MSAVQIFRTLLHRAIFMRTLRAAHRFSRSINPNKIPFFLLGGRLCQRYDALGWREKIVYRALQRRWDAKRQGNK